MLAAQFYENAGSAFKSLINTLINEYPADVISTFLGLLYLESTTPEQREEYHKTVGFSPIPVNSLNPGHTEQEVSFFMDLIPALNDMGKLNPEDIVLAGEIFARQYNKIPANDRVNIINKMGFSPS